MHTEFIVLNFGTKYLHLEAEVFEVKSLSKLLLPVMIFSLLPFASPIAQGLANACEWVNFRDGWFSKAWCGGTKQSITRQWSGTDTTFTGKGGWFYATWDSVGGNWIPDISRYAGDPNHWPLVSSFGKDYSLKWTGSGDITPNGGEYTFGLKFELAGIDHWRFYDMTSSYECYIVTQTNRKDWTWMTQHIGVVYHPGSPVGYDCNRQIQGIFICAETFSSKGWIRIENIDIPDITTSGTNSVLSIVSQARQRESGKSERISLDVRRKAFSRGHLVDVNFLNLKRF